MKIVAAIVITAIAAAAVIALTLNIGDRSAEIANEPTQSAEGTDGTQPENRQQGADTNSATVNTALGNNTNVTMEPSPVILQLCAARDGGRVWSCAARGTSSYAITGDALTVDRPMDVYDVDGTFLISCGGYQAFTTEEARLANEAACERYTISDCRDVTDQCPISQE